jgi:hypothetical protein
MDLLGFFKERNDFLEIKICFPLKNPRPHRILRFRIGCGPAPCGSRAAVRLGSVWAGVWPGKRVAGRTGSGRIGCGHSRVWFPVYRAVPCCFNVAQGVRRNAPKGDGGVSRPCRRRGPTAPGGWSPHDSLTGFPRVAGSKGHAPWGNGHRGEVGAGAGAATAAWQWCWRPLPVWERANRGCYGVREEARAQGGYQ